jgi:hypothetical protein
LKEKLLWQLKAELEQKGLELLEDVVSWYHGDVDDDYLRTEVKNLIAKNMEYGQLEEEIANESVD